jgi:Mn2+/Fe2+ NRAMP family transporter
MPTRERASRRDEPADKASLATAVINGFVAPPLLVMIMVVANNRKIMGKRTNGRVTNVLGWATAIVMFLAAGVLVVTSI